jgi:hypothetical protein
MKTLIGSVESRHAKTNLDGQKVFEANPGGRGFGSDNPKGSTGISRVGFAPDPINPLASAGFCSCGAGLFSGQDECPCCYRKP